MGTAPTPTDPTPEERVRALARSGVRAGLLSHEQLHEEVAEAITTELPDRAGEAQQLATSWVEAAHDELREDQREWPESTDYERLQSAFAELEMLDVTVLQGCEDRSAAENALAGADPGRRPRGIAWFTPADVRRAVEEGLLALRLIPAAPDDELAGDVLGILEKHGLRGHAEDPRESGDTAPSGDGGVEVEAQWQKPIAP